MQRSTTQPIIVVTGKNAGDIASRYNGEQLCAKAIATHDSRLALHVEMTVNQSSAVDAGGCNPSLHTHLRRVHNHMDWIAAAGRYRFPLTDKQS